MGKIKIQKNKGFTLVETMVAIFVLTISITAFMGVVASGLFNSRYTRNEVTANYLMQEVVDYIRNDRDTKVLLGNVSWDDFLEGYDNCTEDNNCYIKILSDEGQHQCDVDCILYYDPDATDGSYYENHDDSKNITSFRRKIIVKRNVSNPDQADITVTVSWVSGNKTISRSLTSSLLKW